jgi:hypothetical protein
MRHPHFGILQPASFIPEDGDPRFQALSQFVIDQAIADWPLKEECLAVEFRLVP